MILYQVLEMMMMRLRINFDFSLANVICTIQSYGTILYYTFPSTFSFFFNNICVHLDLRARLKFS